MLSQRVAWRIAVIVAAAFSASPAAAQFYPKVDYYQTSVDMLRAAATGDRSAGGSTLGALASLKDPDLLPLFQTMTTSSYGPTRVYGVLGSALVTGGSRGIDPAAVLALQGAAERGVAVREANATGLLHNTAVAEILASTDLEPGTVLTLLGELDRRGEPWDLERARPITAAEDTTMAGVACLLLLSKGDPAPWQAFTERWRAMPEPRRSVALRGLAEGALVFDIQEAVDPLIACAATEGIADDAHMAVVGAALTLDADKGLQVWQARVATRRTQPQLLRAGLQLLTADETRIPASAFEQVRNGSAVLDALAHCGAALRTGTDPAAALIALLDAGYPVTSEWALLRTRKLPQEQAARVWAHILAAMESTNPDDRPTPLLASLAIRELMTSNPAAVRALVERARTEPVLAVAMLAGVYESGAPEGVEIARALRGSLPRAGESLAALILARGGAPLSDDDFDVLGRAAAGGGDLEAMRAVHAAWFLIKRRGKAADAFEVICGPGAAPPKPASGAAR